MHQRFQLAPGAWRAQPGPQVHAMLSRDCPELLFGGARGGGHRPPR
jgi:hypothetical protein